MEWNRTVYLLLLFFTNPTVQIFSNSLTTTSVSLGGTQIHGSKGLDSAKLVGVPIQLAGEDIQTEFETSCGGPRKIGLEMIVAEPLKMPITIYRKTWSCQGPSAGEASYIERHTLTLDLPAALLFGPGPFLAEPIEVGSALLRLWIAHPDTSARDGYNQAIVRDYAVLDSVPPFARPARPSMACLSWSRTLVMAYRQQSTCPAENEIVELLTFPVASSHQGTGVVRFLSPFVNRVLESSRIKLQHKPRISISLRLLLLEDCKLNSCALLQHVNSAQNFSTPLLLLKSSGNLHVQVCTVTGQSLAIISPFTFPLHTWLRLHLTFNGQWMTVSLSNGEDIKQKNYMEYMWPEPLLYDDTDGYLVIGGGRYIKGPNAVFGPVSLSRLTNVPTHKMDRTLFSDETIQPGLENWLNKCSLLRARFASWLHDMQHLLDDPESCSSVYRQLLTKHSRREGSCNSEQPIQKRQHVLYTTLEHLVMRHHASRNQDFLRLRLAVRLYQKGLRRVITGMNLQLRGDWKAIAWLEQAVCLGSGRAATLLAAIFRVGLQRQKDDNQALLFSLLAAQTGDRLGLLSAAAHHAHGTDGYVKDPALAYAYYSRLSILTTHDRLRHSTAQAYVEPVKLNDDEAIKAQTSKDGHLYQWLELQARRGDREAQRALGQMLYWGQQGVARQFEAAAHYYEQLAMDTRDPVAISNFAVILFQGHGVKKDEARALRLLQEAVTKGSPEAENALGWYEFEMQGQAKRAVQHWDQADAMGSPDGAYNLGSLHESGAHPDSTRPNMKLALELFLRAAQRGQLNGGARCAEFFMLGLDTSQPRNPDLAIRWARWVCEQNGYLGKVLQLALQTYLNQKWPNALLYYLVAAEAGFEPAQFNLAHICREYPIETGSIMAVPCEWRYYNHLVQQGTTDPNVMLRLGDGFYYGDTSVGHIVYSEAARMYAAAASTGNPQGWYNLAWLVETGVKVPQSIWDELHISMTHRRDLSSLTCHLYSRCRDHDNDAAFIACSLQLLRLRLITLFQLRHIYQLKTSMLRKAAVEGRTASTFNPKQTRVVVCHHEPVLAASV
uniref:protein sel-1 homolog 3 isoform X2 n=1 Tax=Myxine glutinosa TaxID=7769 RepID=UPI00358FA452